MRGLVAFGFHLIGETVFLLKSLYQLGFVRFFGFYFWIGVNRDASFRIAFLASVTFIISDSFIRDLCINRSNHQKPTFHPLGDFLNPALAKGKLNTVKNTAKMVFPVLWKQTKISL
jgi:hypothetical protein